MEARHTITEHLTFSSAFERLPEGLLIDGQMAALLDRAEETRLTKLLTRQREAQFVLGRFLAKKLVASQHGLSPQEVEIRLSQSGQPTAWRRTSQNFLSWTSISHAGSWVGVAASVSSPVGIDIEEKNQGCQLFPFQKSILHPAEARQLELMSSAGRAEWLLRVFSLKESILKAKGLGLTVDLKGLCIGTPELKVTPLSQLSDPTLPGSHSFDLDATHILSLSILGS